MMKTVKRRRVSLTSVVRVVPVGERVWEIICSFVGGVGGEFFCIMCLCGWV